MEVNATTWRLSEYAVGEAKEELNYPEQLPSNPWGSFYIGGFEINQPEVGNTHH